MDELVSLCKRRGFVFQSGEVYGGLQGVYDYGPLGVELKNNLKHSWWSAMIFERDDIEGLDAAILSKKEVFKYSGHEDTFSDPLVDCKDCKSRWREDLIVDGKCPGCGSHDLTSPRPFNLMFKTPVGPVENEESFAYLRPETAQHIFTSFKNVQDSTSRQIPFGIAQIGKAFRNEINPRNFIFRLREFEQMELEYFVKPGEDEAALDYWCAERLGWWEKQGVNPSSLEIYNVPNEELAHYSKKTIDILYRFPHGLEELEGIANRTDFDLGSHTKNQDDLSLTSKTMENDESTMRLAVQDLEAKKWYVPFDGKADYDDFVKWWPDSLKQYIFSKKFVVQEFIERSGQAEVFRAVDPRTQEEFAIKYFLQHIKNLTVGTTTKGIQGEIAALEKLDEHQNILNYQKIQQPPS